LQKLIKIQNMKKLLLSLGVFASLTINAQTLVNGDFEATFTEYPTLPGNFDVPGWFAWGTSAETTTPFAGLQSAKIETRVDAALNAALGWGDDNITGYLSQTIDGVVAHPENVELSFMYKFTDVANDSAYVEVTIIDTLAAGSADDVVLYYDYLNLTASVGTFTNEVFTMNATGLTGTANRIEFYALSTQTGYFQNSGGSWDTPTIGTILWMDNFVLTNNAVSIEENEELTATVYPNPTNDFLNFKMNRDVQSMEVISMDGKVVISAEFNSTIGAVNVSELEKGIYTYVLTSVNGEKSTSTFVKK
jgi:hypothetical protein